MSMLTFEIPTEEEEAADSKFAKPAPGEYIWTLKAIESEPASTFQPDKPRCKFVFTIKEVVAILDHNYPVDPTDDDAVDEYEESLIGTDIWEFCPYYKRPAANSTLRQLLQGMLGRTMTGGDKFNPPDFIGKDYKVDYGDKTFLIKSEGNKEVTKRMILSIKPHAASRRQRQRTVETQGEGDPC